MDGSSAETTTPLVGLDRPLEAVTDDDVESQEGPSVTQDDHKTPSSLPISPTVSALQSFVDRVLHFLGHASNEALGACFVGLGFATYLLLGRVGLLAIGVVGGVVLHATWEGVRPDNRDDATRRAEQERRREACIEVARRVLEWRSNGRDIEERTRDPKVFVGQILDYSSFGPGTSSALDSFTNAVIQNYVRWWYDPVVPDEHNFPESCRQTLTAFVLSLSGHLHRKRPADVFLDFVANASSIVIVFLTELSSALNASPNMPVDQAIAAYLKLKPESSLSYMLDQDSQKSKLSHAAEDILQAYLDHKAYNCQPVHAFLKAVLARIVLGYTVDSCARPEWLNDWIVYGLEESQTTKEVMEIVDAGVKRGAKDSSASIVTTNEINAQKTAKNSTESREPVAEHRRQMSRAEEAMDEAMQEARRLTELMIAEDQRLARESKDKESLDVHESGTEGASERTSIGTSTPTSSQSDVDKVDSDNVTSRDTGSPSTTKEQMSQSHGEQFTNFDQIVPRNQPTALSVDDLDKSTQVLTFQNAYIEFLPGIDEDQSPKANPNVDYAIQITPSLGPRGWMIWRKYADFEKLHGNLSRISKVTSASQFSIDHPALPDLKHQVDDKSKAQTKAVLRMELQKYLRDAVIYQPLAECTGMKNFLAQDTEVNKSPNAPKGFWPTPDTFTKLGGDMMGALSKAPKQVTGGRKAIIGGVTSLVGVNKRQSQSQSGLNRPLSTTVLDETASSAHKSQSSLSQAVIGDVDLMSLNNGHVSHDNSVDSLSEPRGGGIAKRSTESARKIGASPLRPSSLMEQENHSQPDLSQSVVGSQSPVAGSEMVESMELPPPPSEMPPDYISPASPGKGGIERTSSFIDQRLKEASESEGLPPPTPPRPKPTPSGASIKPKEALTERETSIAVELIFAIVTQLYTLSSAWQFRRTLLAAVKAYLLRPGNLQLISIRDLLQTSLLDSNLSDEGMAHHISKLRANTLPTEEETEAWKRDYPEKSAEEKEEIRIKARKLLVTKGMPQALTSVMGAAASGEALGKVFDCLQIPEVSRGLIYGLLLQALRVITN